MDQQRFQEWWGRQAKWWKGFYLTLVIAFVALVALRVSPIDAVWAAGMWAGGVGSAIWISEKLKERMRP